MTSAKIPTKPRKKKAAEEPLSEREKLAAKIFGKYAWIPYSSEDFNRDKKHEIELEDRA